MDSDIGMLISTEIGTLRIHIVQKIIAIARATPSDIQMEITTFCIAVTDKGMTILVLSLM